MPTFVRRDRTRSFHLGDQPRNLIPGYKNYGALIADGTYDPAGFTVALGLKDIRLALAYKSPPD
jgi:hypothetical protein